MLHVIWGVEEASLGNLPSALFDFEDRLLPLSIADQANLSWRMYCLAMCAVLRIYLTDGKGALAHIQAANGLSKKFEPELSLLEAIACRVDGDIETAFHIANLTYEHDDSEHEVLRNCQALIKEIALRNKLAGCLDGLELYHSKNDSPKDMGYVIVVSALLRAKISGALSNTTEYDVSKIRIKPYEYLLLQTLLEDCLEEPLPMVEWTEKPRGEDW